jgi:NitT/TauT family transport system substrate-binding protein
MEQFDWKMLTGKKVMGWRTGTTPGVFFEAAMKARRLDIKGGMDLVTSVSVPARMGAWQAGQFDFAVFFEPEVSRLETAGQAFPVASIGKEIGPVDYTVFIATDAYLKKNPAVVQRFTDAVYKAQKWTATADAREAARLASPYFPGMAVELIASSIERYRKFGIWKTDPETKPEALARLQDLLIEGGVLKPDKRVKFESVVDPTFARKAKETVK